MLMDDLEGATASCIGINKSVAMSSMKRSKSALCDAPAAAATKQSNGVQSSESLMEPQTPPPPQPATTPVAGFTSCRTKWRRDSQPPQWFKDHVAEERVRTDAWREEIRGHFIRMENFQKERVALFNKAVTFMQNQKQNQ